MIYHPPVVTGAADIGAAEGGVWRGSVSPLLFLEGEGMSSSMYASIRRNPRFAELVAKRTRFATILSIVVLAIFYGFVLLVAVAPGLIAQRRSEGSNLTFGVAVGLFQFVFFWVLTLIYVRRANGEFDDINNEIVRAALKEEK